jgi:hypothetical protein
MNIYKDTTERKSGVYFSEEIEGLKVELKHPTVAQDREFKNLAFTLHNKPYDLMCETLALQLSIDGKELTAIEIADTLSDEFITLLAVKLAEARKK